MQRRLRAALPPREFVYEYVGLERAGRRSSISIGRLNGVSAEVVNVRASSPSPSLSLATVSAS